MENASKALLIAAEVLVAVLVISVGVALFSSFAGSSKNIVQKLEESKVAEFNDNFFKYYGDNVIVTAHDVVTMANVAKQNNIDYEIQDNSKYNNNSYYVQIQVGKDLNFEKKTENEYSNFIKNNMLVQDEDGKLTKTKLFKCKKIITSEQTGRVIFIQIDEN